MAVKYIKIDAENLQENSIVKRKQCYNHDGTSLNSINVKLFRS